MRKQTKPAKTRNVIAITTLVVVLALGGVGAYLGIPVGLKVKINDVESVATNVAKFDAGVHGQYLSVGKVDAEGNLVDEPFKILAFTDLHLDKSYKKGAKTIDNMLAAIYTEKPDLLIFTGDIITSATNWLRVKQFGELLEKVGIYWCPILGNHEGDNAFALKRAKTVEIWSGYEHCLMHDDPVALSDNVWGNGNYVVNIVKSGGIVEQSLIFVDSGDRVSKADAKRLGIVDDGYDYVKPSQIKWYNGVMDNLDAIEQDEPIKSMLYLHIPLRQYLDALKIIKDEELAVGATASDKTTQYVFGNAYERVCASDHDSGLFDAILKGKSTQAVFCGHDHVNNFNIKYKGINLVYNQKSGYSSYDMASKGLGTPNQGYTKTIVDKDGKIAISHHTYI